MWVRVLVHSSGGGGGTGIWSQFPMGVEGKLCILGGVT